jgi:hypothetical protein
MAGYFPDLASIVEIWILEKGLFEKEGRLKVPVLGSDRSGLAPTAVSCTTLRHE